MRLARYTLYRIVQVIPVIVGVLTITFFLSNQIPGDPVEIMLGPNPSAGMVDEIQAKYGLDRPIHERYFNYLASVAQGDLGHSIHYNAPVLDKILERLPATALLMTSAFTFAIVTAIPLGVLSAHKRNETADHVSRIVALFGVSTPSFWIGLILIILFAYQMQVLPATGLVFPWAPPGEVRGASTRIDVLISSVRHLILPTISLGTLRMASITRIERASMVETLQSEYVKLARAYGVPERRILRKHAFRVAQLPVITMVGLQLSSALGGAVIIEIVFNINGMGQLIIQAIANRDYELIMGTTFFFGLTFLIGVIITDLSYAYIDPRVTYGDNS